VAISNPVSIGTAVNGASSSTIALTTTGAVTAGAKIWVVVGWFQTPGGTLTSVADGTNTYTIDVQGVNTDDGLAICQADCPAGLAGSSTITATFNTAKLDRHICAMYSTGVTTGAGAAYNPVSQNQSGTAWSSTTHVVNNGDIHIGGSHWEDSAGATSTPSGGNTEVHDFTTGGGSSVTSVYQIGTGASIAASGTWSLASGATGLRSSAVAYSASGAAGPTQQTFFRMFQP
jgi:hypothetical protein